MVHGQNLLAEVEGVPQRLGFYTNVFVEAFTAAEAESRAIDILRDDSHLRDIALNADGDPLRLTVDDVYEIDSFDGVRLPWQGLSLYEEK